MGALAPRHTTLAGTQADGLSKSWKRGVGASAGKEGGGREINKTTLMQEEYMIFVFKVFRQGSPFYMQVKI